MIDKQFLGMRKPNLKRITFCSVSCNLWPLKLRFVDIFQAFLDYLPVGQESEPRKLDITKKFLWKEKRKCMQHTSPVMLPC